MQDCQPDYLAVMSTRVLAAVVANEGRFLVCQRPLHKRHGGLWEFPGGKLESGESDLDAIRRELAEELAIRVTSLGTELFSVEDPGSEFVIIFVLATVEGQPDRREHIDLRWCTPSELGDLPLAPSDRRFVQTVLLRDHSSS